MGNKMTREEELKGLESVCSFLGSMSDDERFEYLMKNSKSFKKEMAKMLKEFGLENVDRVGVEMTNGGQFRVWALPVIPGFVPEKRKRAKKTVDNSPGTADNGE